jgi:hypothetical protein
MEHINILVTYRRKPIRINKIGGFLMAEVDNENKITFEELAPSLQELFKDTVTKDSFDDLVKKLNSIADNLENLTDQYVKKTEVWEAFHKLEDNKNPGTSDADWNKEGMYVINYNKPTISNQPASSGQLINIPYDKDVNYSTQLFISQPDGDLYIRASNGNINGTKFKRVMTSDDVSGVPAVGRVIFYAYDVNPSTEYPGTHWVRISDAYVKCGFPTVGEVNIKNSTTDVTTKTGSASLKIAEVNLPPHSHNGSTTNTTGQHHHGTAFAERYLDGGYKWGLYDNSQNNYGSSGGEDHDNVLPNTSTEGAHAHSISSTSSPNCKSTPLPNNPYGAVLAAWYRVS